MATYGKIFFVLQNGKATLEVPNIKTRTALAAYAQSLQALSCAQVTQVEFTEIIDIDTLESTGKYAEIHFRVHISLRDTDTQENYSVLIPAPKDMVFEMLDGRFQIVPALIGAEIAQAFQNATGKNVEFTRGKLCHLAP